MDLKNYFEEITSLIHYSEGKYNLFEIENMIPWEFDIYLLMFSDYLDKINK